MGPPSLDSAPPSTVADAAARAGQLTCGPHDATTAHLVVDGPPTQANREGGDWTVYREGVSCSYGAL